MGRMTMMRTTKRGPASTARLRQVVIISVMCLALYCFLLVPDHSLDSSRSSMLETFPRPQAKPESESAEELPQALLNNRLLTSSQCRATFPGLTKEIDDVVAKGPFTLIRNPHGLGPTVARIRSGQLSILTYARKADLSKDMLQHRSATLHQIAAALLTTPPSEPVPDTIIAFNHEDDPKSHTLSYARPADPSLNGPAKRFFPIPHFSFYSWPIRTVVSQARAAAAISRIETATNPHSTWASKPARAIWRGTPWFNNPRLAHLRSDLVLLARDKPWADIEALLPNNSNALPIEDFCRYRYIVHTEGVTYSGRLQYHQQCGSVVLAPPIAWMQHLTHLVKPVFSAALQLEGSARSAPPDASFARDDGRSQPRKPAPYPAPWALAAWPTSHDPSTEANMVFVAPDWTDLEPTIAWLEQHPDTAAAIAHRQREIGRAHV